MKLKLLSLVVGLLAMSQAHADQIVIDNVVVPQGGTATLDVRYVFDVEDTNVGFKFNLLLPSGISTVKDEDGLPVYSKNDDVLGKFTIIPTENDGFGAIPNTTTATIKGSEGVLISITLYADASLEVGSKLTATVYNLSLSTKDGDGNLTTVNLENLTFEVTVGEPTDTRVVIDEDATTLPTDATGVDVRVKRTITANSYNTIVLPFTMNAELVTSVFGSDVVLMDFDGIETTLDANDNITDITVKFNTATAIEANHPYVIKASKDINEFTLDGVDIVVEEEPSVEKDEYTVGKGKTAVTFHNRMVGNYVSGLEIPKLCLFLSGNDFWYSTGHTKMKGLRAYFDFYDVLTSVEDVYSIKIRINDSPTGIDSTTATQLQTKNSVYNINGMFMGKVQRGINVVNGNKVLIK